MMRNVNEGEKSDYEENDDKWKGNEGKREKDKGEKERRR